MNTIESYGKSGNAPKGSIGNPYTIEELDDMTNTGTWTGGYVLNMGYVLPEVDVIASWIGSGFVSDFWDSYHWMDPYWYPYDFEEALLYGNSSSEGCGNRGDGGGWHGSGGNIGEGHGSGSNISGGNADSSIQVKRYPTLPPGLSSEIPFVGAVMSGAVYRDGQYNNYMENLERLDCDEVTDIISDYITGLDCKLFKKGSKYILAFAGTEMDKSYPIPTPYGVVCYNPDEVTDFIQLYGPWGQYYQVIGFAKDLVKKFGVNNVMFVGHSLGGGLAALASIVTGCTALTYNPAALSPATVLYLKAVGYGYDTSHIYRYIMDGDPLTKYQIMESEGIRKNVYNYTQGGAHDISTMIDNISPTYKLDKNEK